MALTIVAYACIMLAPILFGLAVLFVAQGIRGERRGSATYCVECGYELEAHGPKGLQCPECGRDLRHPHSTVIGRNHRLWKRVLAGLSLFALALLMLVLAWLLRSL